MNVDQDSFLISLFIALSTDPLGEELAPERAQPVFPGGGPGGDEAPDPPGGGGPVRRARPRGAHGEHEGRSPHGARHAPPAHGIHLEARDRRGQARRAH